MPHPTTITPTILDTILGHLSGHFMLCANNDLPTARHAASRMLAACHAETEDELHLAADIVSFGFHALESLSEAAAPDLSLNHKLRLRGSAISLSREGHKARRKLDQLQRARLTDASQPEAQPAAAPDKATPDKATPDQAATDQAATDQALGLIEFAHKAIQASGKKGGIQGFSLNHQQRRAAEQITKNLRRNKAEQDRRDLAKPATATPVSHPATTQDHPAAHP